MVYTYKYINKTLFRW